MGKFDISSLRTLQDLERKYNFNSMKKAIEITVKTITKTNNELDNILNSLIISLEDVLDSQSEISLWFYSGTPTLLNEPYISWNDPTDHYGDLYYDKATGYVYQYKEVKGWELQVDPNLIQALAITNSQSDTSTDHERKVSFIQPTPPYSNGDWWIKEDSSLYVCQVTKDIEQSYEDSDWIAINDYTESVAEKINDILTVLKGSVTIINDSYAKFTDLATGGSTIIDGANIKTGTIDATQVRIENDNVVIDEDGISMSNGAKIVSEYGLYSNLQVASGSSESYIGFNNYVTDGYHKTYVILNIYIPDDFVIKDARVTLYVKPQYVVWNVGSQKAWGYPRNIKLYSADTLGPYRTAYINGEVYYSNETYDEILNAFGSESYTMPTPTDNSHDCQVITSINLKDYLTNGPNSLAIACDVSYTSSTINGENYDSSNYGGDDYLAAKYSGTCLAYLNIFGYANVENL